MNWPLFLQLLVTAVVAFMGAFLAHLLNARRDRANAIRQQRLTFLIDVYRRLESISNRQFIDDPKQLEASLGDLQLFGSRKQIEMAQQFIRDFAINKTGSCDALLEDLRIELRDELGLTPVPPKMLFLRILDDKK